MPRTPHPLRLAQLLTGRTGILGEILTRAARLQSLAQDLDSCLPPELRPHCHLADLREGVLVLHADSPVWAARLRYLGAEILEGMRRRCCAGAPKTLQVKVSLSEGLEGRRGPPRATLTPHSAECLRCAAQALTDPDLRAALLRIAGR